MSQRNSINWTNTLFLTLTPVVGIIGTVLLLVFSHVAWQTWVLAGSILAACGISITVGYHRLFSHRTFEAAWPVRLLTILFGSASFEGSVFEWCTDHRDHHRYSDTEKDPYSVKVSFWHAHIGWLLRLDTTKRTFTNIDDLKKSWMLRFQNRHFILISSIMGFVLPTAIAALWGQALAGFIVAGALRIAVSHHSTFCINSLCHILGKRPYDDKSTACDNWASALVTFGEGYHNYHHQFPLDYRNGVRFYQFDPAKWLISGLSYVGLARNLRRVPRYRIIQAMVESHQSSMPSEAKPRHSMLHSLQESIMNTITNIREFERAYAESRTREIRIKIKSAKSELQGLFCAWKRLRYAPVISS